MPIQSVQKPMSRRSALLPWVVFAVAAGLALAAWAMTARQVRRTNQANFERLTERVQSTLHRRFDTAALLLHGAAAFPVASDRVTAADWSLYFRTISNQLGNGVVGLGYAQRVARTEIDALETRMRGDGEKDFTVERIGTNEWLYVVEAIEPREHNTGVLGADIGSGVTRKEAAERAAAENSLILSRRIRVNYDGNEVPGFLMFLPLYEKDANLATREQRLASVRGWVYAAIRIDQLMMGVAEGAIQQIDLDVFEGDAMEVGNLLYDADGQFSQPADSPTMNEGRSAGALRTVQSVDIYGRRWTLSLSSRPEFARIGFSSLPALVLVVGVVFSALVSLLTWALVNSRTQAIKLAGDMTVDLRRLALVASHTGNGVILTDAEWRVEWINEGFTRMFGFSLEEIKGRKPADFMMGPDSDPKAMELMDEAAKLRRPFKGEVLNYTKDQRKVWIELEIQPILTQEGGLEGFMGLQLDITERKRQAEQMQEAMEAAEKANQAKSQFLAMMSHEIRTPMTGVIGMTSLLLDTPLNPEQRESAEIIRQSGESLLTIINDILDFSKIESGRLDIENIEFALNECVEGAVDLLAAPAAKKQIELIYEIADDLPAMVLGDAARLRQVLVNLVGNAVKFTQQGEVAVTVAATARKGSHVELLFAVRDSGIGISADGMARLFKPFSQVDASMTRKFGGTGLGLVISRRLVELMGGTIRAESELGRGSTFSFSLSLPVVADGMVIPPGAPGSLNGRRVLIAEGNETARRILVGRTAEWGMIPVGAATSAAALEHLRRDDKFDVAILALQLLDMDGRKLGAAIRELPARAKLPLILLSAQGQRENPGGLFKAIITKPVKPTQLFDTFVETFWPTRSAASTAPMKLAPAPLPEVKPVRVLFNEPTVEKQGAVLEQLGRFGCRADVAANRAEIIDALSRRSYDVAFVDLCASLADGLETARRIRYELLGTTDTWLVAVTGELKTSEHQSCHEIGINDYLIRPFTEAQLSAVLERAKWRLPS